MPKGTDLSVRSQDDLDAITFQLNTRPRKRLGVRTPLEVFMDLLKQTQSPRQEFINRVLHLELENALP
jgi:IS30 family transposase